MPLFGTRCDKDVVKNPGACPACTRNPGAVDDPAPGAFVSQNALTNRLFLSNPRRAEMVTKCAPFFDEMSHQ